MAQGDWCLSALADASANRNRAANAVCLKSGADELASRDGIYATTLAPQPKTQKAA